MKLTNVLNNTNGRFTTLVVNNNKENTTYCAQSITATNNYVSFFDVNAGRARRVPTQKVRFVRSGQLQYPQARNR